MWLIATIALLTLSADAKPFDNARRLTTFNTGLFPAVPRLSARRNGLINALELNKIQSDVVCLQEVYFADDLRAVQNAAKSRFPYSYSFLSSEGSDDASPCNSHKSLVRCLNNNCRYAAGFALQLCSIQKCKNQLKHLSQKCINCIVMKSTSQMSEPTGFGKLKSAIDSCSTPNEGFPNTYGLLLLSRYPMGNQKRKAFHDKSILPTAYLKADIDTVGTVLCTQLTMNLGDGSLYLDIADYQSYKEHNKAEVNRLMQAVKGETNIVIMGNFNFGPQGLMADNYQLIRSKGFESPYSDNVGLCTRCADNRNNEIKDQALSDHIFIQSNKMNRVLESKRELEESITSEDFPLSDHFGVTVTVSKL